jgi:transcriptional regulator with XRE-family HTH domain
MSAPSGPTALRRIVGAELRRLRIEKGVTQQEAAKAVGIGSNNLSRYESGVASMSNPVAEKLFEYYGVEAERVAELLELVARSRRRGQLKDIQGQVWKPVEDLIALERDAATIQAAAMQAIPGLLQTEHYARAMLSYGALGVEAVEDQVQTRLGRAAILERQDLSYWVVLHEAVLRCAVGGAAVMREQLEHVCEVAKRRNVTIQVLPDNAGEHPAVAGAFTILRFTVAPEYGVVYHDYLTGALYLDEPEEVAQYDDAYLHLIKMALSEKASLAFIKKLSRELFS